MDEKNLTVIKSLTEHANEIVAGSYKNVDKLFSLTDKTDNSHDLSELAEAFGMMLLQVETREYALKQTIEELKKKNTHIESLNNIRSQLSSLFVNIVLLVTSFIFVLGILTDYSSKLPFLIVFIDYPVIEILLLLLIIVASRPTLNAKTGNSILPGPSLDYSNKSNHQINKHRVHIRLEHTIRTFLRSWGCYPQRH